MGQSISELIESEKYSEFLESYSIDDTEAATHRARRSPRMSRWEPILGFVTIIALLAAFLYLLIGGQYSGFVIVSAMGGASVLILISMMLDLAPNYQARKSKTTDRDLICYEVQTAIENYQQEDYEAVYQHLSDLQSVLSPGREQGLSDRMKRWLLTYLDRIENSEHREDAIEKTFDRLAVHFIDDLTGQHDTEIYDIIQSIDVEDEEREESSSRRALIDVGKTAGSIVASRYGIIGFSFLAASLVYFIFNQLTIAVAIPGVILTIYQIW